VRQLNVSSNKSSGSWDTISLDLEVGAYLFFFNLNVGASFLLFFSIISNLDVDAFALSVVLSCRLMHLLPLNLEVNVSIISYNFVFISHLRWKGKRIKDCSKINKKFDTSLLVGKSTIKTCISVADLSVSCRPNYVE
jgi:hypothetical protein